MKIMFPRDEKLFELLWQYKILTTHAIWLACFKEASIKTCYERLMKLKKANYIKIVLISGTARVWSLSTNGFLILKEKLPEFTVPGYGSESPIHDSLVNMVSFGDTWPLLPPTVKFLSEEKMKRFPLEYLPSWYPLDLLRRPDGIWKLDFNDKYKLFALEVETSLKAPAKYETIARQYQDCNSIYGVLWFVPGISMAETIYQNLKNRVGIENFKHCFILLSDFVSAGWESKTIGSDTRISELRKSLNPQTGNASVLRRKLCHLDLSICPQNSITSKNLFKSEYSDLAHHFKSGPFSSFLSFRPKKVISQ